MTPPPRKNTLVRGIKYPTADRRYGWVYILTAGPICKIGSTVDLAWRMKRFYAHRDRAYDIDFHCAFRVPSTVYARIEGDAHVKLMGYRAGSSNDWFLVDTFLAECIVRDAVILRVGTSQPIHRFPKDEQ